MTRFLVLLMTTLASAHVASADVRHELAELYPEQGPAVLARRIAAVDSKEGFFKSFAPYFYRHARQDILVQGSWSNVTRFQSWCVGDGHPENFGVLLSNEGQPVFTMNDVDDASPCPVAADVLRFFTGWALATDSDPINFLMPAYLRGIRGEMSPLPKVLEKMLVDGRDAGLVPKTKWVKNGQFKNAKDLQPVPPVLDPELRHWAVQSAGNGWTAVDLRERVNFSGGSGGLHRFLVLLRDPIGRFALLEFKEITHAATFPLGVPEMDPTARIRGAWNLEQAPVASHWMNVVTIVGRPFFTRPLWDGNLNLKIKGFTDKQTAEVAAYEATLLGALHRRGGASADFVNAVSAMAPATWSLATDQLRKVIKAAYQEIR